MFEEQTRWLNREQQQQTMEFQQDAPLQDWNAGQNAEIPFQQQQSEQRQQQVQYDVVEMRKQLHRAARTGNLDQLCNIVSLIINADGNKDNATKMFRKKDTEGRYVIQNALLNGHFAVVNYLLDEWAEAHTSLNLLLDGHMSVLHQALAMGSLIQHSQQHRFQDGFRNHQLVNTNTAATTHAGKSVALDNNNQFANDMQNSPLDLHNKNNQNSSSNINNNQLNRADSFDQYNEDFETQAIQIMVKLVSIGQQVNQRDRLGRTVVHVAAQQGLSRLVSVLLLELKADPLVEDLDGNLPIHLAIEFQQPHSFTVLLKHALGLHRRQAANGMTARQQRRQMTGQEEDYNDEQDNNNNNDDNGEEDEDDEFYDNQGQNEQEEDEEAAGLGGGPWAHQKQTISYFDQVNLACYGEITLVAHTILNQAWSCLVQLIRLAPRDKVLQITATQGLYKGKQPQQIAEECELEQEFDQIVAWLENQPVPEDPSIDLDQQQANLALQKTPSYTLENVLDTLGQTRAKTLMITDQKCMEHAPILFPKIPARRLDQIRSQPENSDRLRVLLDPEVGIFTRSPEFACNRSFRVQKTSKPVSIADVLKVHDFHYIEKVMAMRDSLIGTRNKTIGHFDGADTPMSEKTWEAALLAAGAAVEACDAIMAGEARNAFCAVRPPGHHAGIYGKTFHQEDPLNDNLACSNGFCYINNVAVAAAYLKSHYRDRIKKVAIVDFDVHHGNGTQEIVEALHKPKAFKVTNKVSTFATFEVTHRQYKPWLDFDDGKNVLFTSIHLYNNEKEDRSPYNQTFYPGTGGENENTGSDDISLYPGGILNVPMHPGLCSSENWRFEFTTRIFPRLIEFKPDFILISAGFDAHGKDSIHSPGQTGVSEFDYKWATAHIQQIANQTAEGRVVSVLEGGYGLKNGHLSPLAQSVSTHVRALLNTHSGPLLNGQRTMMQFIESEREKNVILHKRAHPSEFESQEFPNGIISGNGMSLRKRVRIPADTQPTEPFIQEQSQQVEQAGKTHQLVGVGGTGEQLLLNEQLTSDPQHNHTLQNQHNQSAIEEDWNIELEDDVEPENDHPVNDGRDDVQESGVPVRSCLPNDPEFDLS